MKGIFWLVLVVLGMPACGIAGNLEPFKDVPIPEQNPQTQ